MKIIVNFRNVLVLIVSTIMMMAFLLLIPSKSYYYGWFMNTSIYIIGLLVCQLILLCLVKPKKSILIVIMILFTYVFHFSHVILHAFDYDFGSNERNDVFFRQGSDVSVQSTVCEIRMIIFFFLGILFYYLFLKNKKVEDSKQITTSNSFRTMCIVIGLIFDLLNNIFKFVSTISGGYANIGMYELPYGLSFFSLLLLPGILLYVLDHNVSRLKRNVAIICFVTYKIFFMFSGLRAYALINLIVLLYCLYRRNEHKFRIRDFLIFLLLLQIGGGLLVGIRETRIDGINLSRILNICFDIKSNIIFNMMGEFGISQNVVCEIIKNTDLTGNGGRQLLLSIITIIPGISYLIPMDYTSMSLETALNIHNYGGSFIGDFLFDFGESIGLLALFIFGIIIARIFEGFEMKIRNGNIKEVAFISPLIVELLYSCRSSLAKIPRIFVWYTVIVLILKFITRDRLKKEI